MTVDFFLVTVLDWVSETNQGGLNPNNALVTQFRGFKGEEIDATTARTHTDWLLGNRNTRIPDWQLYDRVHKSYIAESINDVE